METHIRLRANYKLKMERWTKWACNVTTFGYRIIVIRERRDRLCIVKHIERFGKGKVEHRIVQLHFRACSDTTI
jgi:hypothetical protein